MKLEKKIKMETLLDTENIAELFEEQQLRQIGSYIDDEAMLMEAGRATWMTNTTEIEGLRKIDLSTRSFPWEGASNATYPLSIDAELRLASRLYTDIIKGSKICKSQIISDDPSEQLLEIAKKREKKLNKQIMENPESEYSENMDELFQKLSAYGTVFQKVYYDSEKTEICFETVDAKDVLISSNVKKIDRYTNLIQNHKLCHSDIQGKINNSYFIDYEYNSDETMDSWNKEKEFREAHILLDLDDDGISEPYCCYMDVELGIIVGIYKRYSEASLKYKGKKLISIKPTQHWIAYRTGFDLDNSFYHYGISGVLYPTANTINALLRQQIDVASLQARQGMIFTKGVRVQGGHQTVRMNENIVVDTAPGAKIKDNILPFPQQQANPMVLQLMELLITLGSKITGVVEMLSMDTAGFGNMKSTVALALIEKGVQNYSALYQRIYRSMTKSFLILSELDKQYFPEMAPGLMLGAEGEMLESMVNIDDLSIMPQADPILSTDMQKSLRINALMELKDDPNINDRAVLEANLKALQVDVNTYMPPQNPNPPPSPDMIMMQQQLQVASEQLRQGDQKLHNESEKIRLEHEREMLKINLDYKIQEINATTKILEVEMKDKAHTLNEVLAQVDQINTESQRDIDILQIQQAQQRGETE